MHVIRHFEETHLEHLEHVCLPIAHAHILAHTEGLQLIIVISRNGRSLHASQYLDAGAHGNLFARSYHGTQRLLGKHGTIEGTWRIVADITMTTILTGSLSEIIQEDSSSADSRFGVFFHSSQFFQIHRFLSAFFAERTEGDDICHRIEQYRIGRCAVSSGSSYLLIETLDALRHVVVNHPAHIALVDTHSEGDGSAHHFYLVHLETLLYRGSLLGGESGMIGFCLYAMLLQSLCHHLRILAREAVDDACLVWATGDEMVNEFQFLLLRTFLAHGKTEVRTIETAHEGLAVQMQLVDDVLSGNLIGCSRERHHRHAIEFLVKESELGILRTEVVAPLTDAVGFIYGEERNLDVAEQIRYLAEKFFGRDIEQFQFARFASSADDEIIGYIVAAVESFGWNAVRLEGFHLVVHQTDEWRNDHCCSLHCQRRNLIAQTLSSARRHQHQTVVTLHYFSDDGFLVGAEGIVSEVRFQYLVDLHIS